MEAMLALVLDLSGWRGPVAFGAVGIFVVAALARLISWGAARRRRRMSLPEGYKSREDVRLALREENIDDWLEKMRSTPAEFKVPQALKPAGLDRGASLFESIDMVIKEFSKGLEKSISLKKPEQDHPSILNYGPEVSLKGEPEHLFTWYRTPGGEILFRMAGPGSAGMARFLTPSTEEVLFAYEGMRVAYPAVGEWWSALVCSVHKRDRDIRVQVQESYSWYRSPERIAELYCGCLAPINFGKGFPKVAGTEYLPPGPDGGAASVGENGSPGLPGIQSPEDRCKLCAGGRQVVKDVGGAYKIVPCPRCKGTGRES